MSIHSTAHVYHTTCKYRGHEGPSPLMEEGQCPLHYSVPQREGGGGGSMHYHKI